MTEALPRPPSEGRSYWCFISYRHADNKESGRQWATWLHQTIEQYEVPADLVGQVNDRGETIPARIFPVFRDEEELPVDADLSSPIYRALDNSQCLLVICSPRAVSSTYVAAEITYFKSLGRADRVLAAMVAGEPNASWDKAKQASGFPPDQECFPEPLRRAVGSDGAILDDQTEPIAADFRLDDGTEGWTSLEAYRQELRRSGRLKSGEIAKAVEAYQRKSELMKLKIVAGILGVDLGTLTRRDVAYQLAQAQRRARVLRRWLAAVAILAVLAVAGGLRAYQKELEAEYERDQAEQAHLRILTNLSSVRLRDDDVRMAQWVILQVLQRTTRVHPIEPAMMVAFQDARAADYLISGVAVEGGVRDVAFAPGGRRIATAGADGDARLWDVATGSPLGVLKGRGPALRSVAFSPDGGRLVAAAADGTAQLWDVASGAMLVTLGERGGAMNAAAFSPDARRIVTCADDRTARLWSTADFALERVFSGHEAPVSSCAFSPDGQKIVTASRDKTARIWNVDDGTVAQALVGHREFVHSAAFSPDGRRVVTGSQDNNAQIWDARSGESLTTLSGHLRSVNRAAFSPDGRLVVTASLNKTARLWNVATGELVAVLAGHLGSVVAAVFSPNGETVATASTDGSARIWRVQPAGRLRHLSGARDLVTAVAFSPSGSEIAAASGDKTVGVWDWRAARLRGRLEGHNGLVNSVAYAPGGERIVTASYDGTAMVWDARALRPLLTMTAGQATPVTSAAFSPDGRLIATGSFDRTVRLWDAAAGTLLTELPGHTGVVRSIAFSPDGHRLVTASDDKSARLWDVARGTPLGVLSGHHDGVRTAAFSPDGSRVVTASNDQTAILWDGASGKPILAFSGHRGVLRTASFSPDGRFIVTAGYDRTARIWDATTGMQLAEMPVGGLGIRSAVYSPDGTRIATGAIDQTVAVWDARVLADVRDQIAWLQLAQFDPLSRSELTELGFTPNPASPPDVSKLAEARAQARQAERDEQAAIAEAPGDARTALMLSALRHYAAALDQAGDAAGGEVRVWRFHRASLARQLAEAGRMREAAAIGRRAEAP